MKNSELKHLATYQEGFLRFLAEGLEEDMPETSRDILELCDSVRKLVAALDAK